MSPPASSTDFQGLYRDVAASLAATVADLQSLTVDHDEGRREIGAILDKLRSRQQAFDDELALLDGNAEWDKFTVAFFGETNAGKSTLIESLRILFEEESRAQLLAQNANDVERHRARLVEQVALARNGLREAFATQARELQALRQDAARLAAIVQQESAERIQRRLKRFALTSLAAGVLLGAALTAIVLLAHHA